MKHLVILVLGLAAACGKEEAPPKTNTTTPPAMTPEKMPEKAPETAVPEVKATPSVDAAKEALQKSIADTKALIEKKQADAKALLDKAKADPMKAMQYKAEADKLQKEIADLQTKLDGYMKEAAGK